jgi:hypothetical protein
MGDIFNGKVCGDQRRRGLYQRNDRLIKCGTMRRVSLLGQAAAGRRKSLILSR